LGTVDERDLDLQIYACLPSSQDMSRNFANPGKEGKSPKWNFEKVVGVDFKRKKTY